MLLKLRQNLIFSKYDENAAQGMLFEPLNKPVLAREREARLVHKKKEGHLEEYPPTSSFLFGWRGE